MDSAVYEVLKLTQSIEIDADWNKIQWQKSKAVALKNYMGSKPKFFPAVQAKMMYDDDYLYVIFHVKDCCVRCTTKEINGPVWEDACAEFFFAPDTGSPDKYFNLEINCGGTPLMHYNKIAGKDIKIIDPNDIKKIEIAHSLPQIIDPEISENTKWSIEYKIPLRMLEKYSKVSYPKQGVSWRANFYKIAENSSNPHYITWSIVENEIPDFHLPNFFGLLKFQ